MNVEKLSVDKLVHDPRNARRHDEQNIKSIARSLDTFGQQKPIVVTADNVVVAGNGTLAAAKELGWDKIHAVRTKLSEEEVKAFAIADNRTSELATWDYEQLVETFKELEEAGFDIDSTGWDEAERVNLQGMSWDDGEDEDMDTFKPEADASPVLQGDKTKVLAFTPHQWGVLVSKYNTTDADTLSERVMEAVESA